MIVGIIKVIFHFPYLKSLKDKRQKLNSIKQILKQKFNISIAEVDFKNYWQKSFLGISMVSDNKVFIEQNFTKILDYFHNLSYGYIIESNIEYLSLKEIY